MSGNRKPIIFVTIAAGVVVALFSLAVLVGRLEPTPSVTNAVKSGSSATSAVIYAASFPDLNGKMQPLSQWSQRILVINFWATWCAPCVEEIPMLVKMQTTYASVGLQIVGIAADSSANVANFVKKLKINYPVLPDESAAIEFSKRVGNRLGLLPYSIVLNPAGEIVMTKLGVLTEAELIAVVEKYRP